MQVIYDAALLAAVGGGDDGKSAGEGEVSCTVGTGGINCTGSPKSIYKELGYIYENIQEAGGRFGCWLWDVLH